MRIVSSMLLKLRDYPECVRGDIKSSDASHSSHWPHLEQRTHLSGHRSVVYYQNSPASQSVIGDAIHLGCFLGELGDAQ